MNKTVDINLAGFLFHIDEEAYARLKQYLNAVEASLKNDPGKSEIMSDIEARIAELFFDKQAFQNQVINTGMVEEVIAIMGEPEDYEIDDTEAPINEKSAETNTESNPAKKLYRDANDAYAGGVSSGLGHYFNIEPFWIRLAWVLLTIFTSGSFILIYLGFWFFVPRANTTAEQLEMKGQAVNLNNIGQSIRDGSDNIQRKSATFFENAGEILKKLLTFLIKFFGAYLVFIASVVIIGSLITVTSIFIFKAGENYWYDFLSAANIGIPYQLMGLPIFLLVAIPMFFLGFLGMRLLLKRSKAINKPIIFSLIGLWFLSGIIVGVFIYKEVNERSQQAFIHDTTELPFTAKDTLTISALTNLSDTQETNLSRSGFENNSFSVNYDAGEKRILLHKTHLYVKPSSDEKAYIKISKLGRGKNFDSAKANAEAISYDYKIEGNKLILSKDAITAFQNEWKNQHLYINLFIPEGMTVIGNQSTTQMNRNAWDESTSLNHKEGKYVTMENQKLICTSCNTSETMHHDHKENYINDNGINLNFTGDNNEKFHLKIDESGIHIEGKDNNEDFKLNIDENGIQIDGNTD